MTGSNTTQTTSNRSATGSKSTQQNRTTTKVINPEVYTSLLRQLGGSDNYAGASIGQMRAEYQPAETGTNTQNHDLHAGVEAMGALGQALGSTAAQTKAIAQTDAMDRLLQGSFSRLDRLRQLEGRNGTTLLAHNLALQRQLQADDARTARQMMTGRQQMQRMIGRHALDAATTTTTTGNTATTTQQQTNGQTASSTDAPAHVISKRRNKSTPGW